VRRLRERNERMLAVADDAAVPPQESEARQQVVELQRLIFTTEHAALQEARSSGTYRSSTIEYAQTRIDNGAMRLDGE
jgi:hypothetical protein